MSELFARSAEDLFKDGSAPNATEPTPGFGLTLDKNGRVPNAQVLAPSPGASKVLTTDANGVLSWDTGGSISATIVDAKGDLIAATAADTVARLAVGADGSVLAADSTQASGLRWYPTYRKTTTKTVNTTTSATDLLNGEITIGAGVLGTTGVARLTAWGDWKQNAGVNDIAYPRFQVAFGGSTQLDTNTRAIVGNSATKGSWRVTVEIANLASASVQSICITTFISSPNGWSTAGAVNAFTTGAGTTSASTGSAAPGFVVGQGYAAGSIDTSTAKALVLNVINGSANANCETQLFGAVVEIV